MKNFTRRDVCVVLPALAASSALGAQAPSSDTPVPAIVTGTLGDARAIEFDRMPARATANGGEGRDIAHGVLATGETVHVRQSMQLAGAPPLPLHGIQHTEFILVREGELEFQHEVAGQIVSEKAGAGGVFYIPPGTRHSVKNVGDVPARYFVVAIGGDTK
jgi:mannose-6-phosphate isomerase-like protein (cupin superfamily)